MKKKTTKKTAKLPEIRLRDYWEKKLSKAGQKNDTLFSSVLAGATEDLIKHAFMCDIRERIWVGRPLSFTQYHVAIALGLLKTELSYEEFFKKRWHETEGHMAYGLSGRTCPACRAEKQL